jgi:DNA-binding NarL/FixJ family response regulator
MSDALSVLFIDGNHHDCLTYVRFLQSSLTRYEVVQAATGRMGLQLCARQPFDCVVLEIDLSDMSGFEVLTKLVPSPGRPDIAVVVVTILHNPFLLELAIKNGAQAAFHKTMGEEIIVEKAIAKAISTVKERTRASEKSFRR